MKHVNTIVYMLAFLYVHHKVYLNAIPVEEVFRYCPPEGWTDMDHDQKTKLQDEFITFEKDLHSFRIVMSFVFFAQVIAIMMYILFCKVYKALKYKKQGKLDIRDPFQKILSNKNEDFLQNSNFFMSTVMLQFLIIMICFSGWLVITLNLDREKKHNHETVMIEFGDFFLFGQIPLEILLVCLWTYIYWKGTRFEQLFSRKNKLILCTVGGINILIDFIYMCYAYKHLDRDATEVCIIIMCVFLCDLLVYSRYLAMSFKPRFYKTFLQAFVQIDEYDK